LQTLAWITKFEMTLYPLITTQSSRIADILDNLEIVRKRILSELNKALQELDVRIKSIQVFNEIGNQNIFMLHVALNKTYLIKIIKLGEAKATEQILDRLMQMHKKVNTIIKDYEILLESLIFIFRNLEEVRQIFKYFKRTIHNI